MNTQDVPAPPISLFRRDDRSDGVPSHRILDALEEHRRAALDAEARKKRAKRMIFIAARALSVCAAIGLISLTLWFLFAGESDEKNVAHPLPAATATATATAPVAPKNAQSGTVSPRGSPAKKGNSGTAQTSPAPAANKSAPPDAPVKNPLNLLAQKKTKETQAPQENPLRALDSSQNKTLPQDKTSPQDKTRSPFSLFGQKEKPAAEKPVAEKQIAEKPATREKPPAPDALMNLVAQEEKKLNAQPDAQKKARDAKNH